MMVLKNQAFVFVNMLCLLHTYRQIVYLLRSHKKTDALTRYHLSVFQMHSLAKVCCMCACMHCILRESLSGILTNLTIFSTFFIWLPIVFTRHVKIILYSPLGFRNSIVEMFPIFLCVMLAAHFS